MNQEACLLGEDVLVYQLLADQSLKECEEFYIECNRFFKYKDKLFSKEGFFLLDELFANYISKIGSFGKKIAKELILSSRLSSQSYWIDHRIAPLFKLWVDLNSPPYYCRYVKLLVEIIWEDRINKQFYKNKKNVPALTQSIHAFMTRILSPNAQVLIKNGFPILIYEEKIVAQVACVNLDLAPILKIGANHLSSIYHHKLLNHQCKMGFANWVQGITDPKVIRYQRGYTEIAEILGFRFKGAPFIIKSLLCAQAYMHFYFDDQSVGSLISLRYFKSESTSRREGVEVAIEAQLMPHYTFQTTPRGRLLVPIPSLHSFVSASQYHARQASLQMMIMREFTDHSIDLAIEGSILITRQRFAILREKSGLPESVFNKVMDQWVGRENDRSVFLVQKREDRYTLSPAYNRELHFLISQGLIRKNRKCHVKK